MKPEFFLLIGLGIAFFFRDEFATAVRLTFPAIDGEYWKLGPNRQYWLGLQGERVRVIWMNNEMFPPPPTHEPSMQNFTPMGALR